MSLTRAQIMAGDTSQGVVLSGQVQGVKKGSGVSIASNGAISFDATTADGVVLTNNVSAYNGYIWPNTVGTPGQALTIVTGSQLGWQSVGLNVFTQKGQLIAGTGAGSYALQNPGVSTSFLVSEMGSPDGLIYTDDMTSAVLLPVGTTAQRDCYCVPGETALAGQIRYSTTFGTLEFYTGTTWLQVHATDSGILSFVRQTVPPPGAGTSSAVIPGGTTLERQAAPAAGYLRFNSTTKDLEFHNGTDWVPVIYSVSGGTTGLTVTTSLNGGDATISGVLGIANGGTGATSQAAIANNVLPAQTGNNGKYLTTDGTNVSWATIPSGGIQTIVGGYGIEAVTVGNTSTISLNPSVTESFDPILLLPGTEATWASSPTAGLGPQTATLGPYVVNYPAGPNYALMNSRAKASVYFVAGATYSGDGMIWVNNPKYSMTIAGDAVASTGTFSVGVTGLLGGFSSGTFYSAGIILSRSDIVRLTKPTTGGSFTITVTVSIEGSSGPASVQIGSPQFDLQPYFSPN